MKHIFMQSAPEPREEQTRTYSMRMHCCCPKVCNETEEPLWPRCETGRQTAGGAVVRMRSPVFMPHLSSH